MEKIRFRITPYYFISALLSNLADYTFFVIVATKNFPIPFSGGAEAYNLFEATDHVIKLDTIRNPRGESNIDILKDDYA